MSSVQDTNITPSSLPLRPSSPGYPPTLGLFIKSHSPSHKYTPPTLTSDQQRHTIHRKRTRSGRLSVGTEKIEIPSLLPLLTCGPIPTGATLFSTITIFFPKLCHIQLSPYFMYTDYCGRSHSRRSLKSNR